MFDSDIICTIEVVGLGRFDETILDDKIFIERMVDIDNRCVRHERQTNPCSKEAVRSPILRDDFKTLLPPSRVTTSTLNQTKQSRQNHLIHLSTQIHHKYIVHYLY